MSRPKARPNAAQLVEAAGFLFANGVAGERQERLLQRLGAGLLLELVGRALRDDLAVIDDGDAVGDALGFLHVMRGEEDGDLLLFVEFLDVGPELVAGLRVQAERGLVEEDDLGRVQQAARDFQTPPHAAGELLDLILAAIP